jgi:hypothetical protein
MRVAVGVFPEPKSDHRLVGVALIPTAAMHAPLQAIEKMHQRTLPDFDGDGIAEIEGRVDIWIDRGQPVAIFREQRIAGDHDYDLSNVMSAIGASPTVAMEIGDEEIKIGGVELGYRPHFGN